ncbi:hypothetical protein M8J76_002983 [Diaphorina citri]|nr:hypothetical protein M8J76_002983 [Diaphorina citri]
MSDFDELDLYSPDRYSLFNGNYTIRASIKGNVSGHKVKLLRSPLCETANPVIDVNPPFGKVKSFKIGPPHDNPYIPVGGFV